MHKQILVGYDGSEHSHKALKVAAEFTKTNGAELLVFHAIAHHFQLPPIQIPLLPLPGLTLPQQRMLDPKEIKKIYEETGKAIIDQAKKAIEDLHLGIEGNVKYELELDISPEEFAIDYANKNKIDLIVVGCKGHHGRLRRALLGTVASKIVNEAPCQVLVVR